MDELPALGDHAAPGRRVRRHRKADERQDRLDDDRDAHLEAHERHERRDHIGQDLAHEDMEGRKADGARGGHIVSLRLRHRLGAHDAAEARPVDDGDRGDDRSDARAEDGDEQDRQQDRRKRHPDVDEARNRAVDPAADTSPREARARAGQRRETRGDEGDDQRDPRTIDQARQHVAAEVVGAEVVAGLRSRRSPAGGSEASIRSWSSGFFGAIQGAKIAIAISAKMKPPPIVTLGSARSARRRRVADWVARREKRGGGGLRHGRCAFERVARSAMTEPRIEQRDQEIDRDVDRR